MYGLADIFSNWPSTNRKTLQFIEIFVTLFLFIDCIDFHLFLRTSYRSMDKQTDRHVDAPEKE